MTSDPEINANTWNEPAIQFTDFGFENRNTGPTNLDPQSVVLHICDATDRMANNSISWVV